MKKSHSLVIIFLLVMLFGTVAFSSAIDSYPFEGYTTDFVRMRDSSSDQGAILCTLSINSAVNVVGAQGDYVIVRHEGKQGYVLSSYITPNKPAQLLAEDANTASQRAKEVYKSIYYDGTTEQVKSIQNPLKELGYYKSGVDGAYGEGTKKAVENFQKNNGLIVTGVADPATQEKLFESIVVNASLKKETVSYLPDIPNVDISLHKRGPAVITLKERLAELGYYRKTSGDIYDVSTRDALKAFQTKNGLHVDGLAGSKTQAVLYSDSALKKSDKSSAKEIVNPKKKASYPYHTTINAFVLLRKTPQIDGETILSIKEGEIVEVVKKDGQFIKIRYGENEGYVVNVYVDIPDEYYSEDERKYNTLKAGDEGEQVHAVQEALKELGFYAGESNGVYSQGTMEAVKKFQEKNNYFPSGALSREQQLFIFEKRPKNVEGSLKTLKTSAFVQGYSVESGDVGKLVGKVQLALATLGYYEFEITDIFDKNTQNALKAFQKDKGLYLDGVAGPRTQELLFALSTTPVPTLAPTPSPQGTGEDAFSVLTKENAITLNVGTRGVAVKDAELRLIELGYLETQADGIYDENDVNAVKDFQRNNDLRIDGIAGYSTQQYLFGSEAISKAQAKQTVPPQPTETMDEVPSDTAEEINPTQTPNIPSTTPEPNLEYTLRMGSEGIAVEQLQERLVELGYLFDDVDGNFGISTKQAVKAFQKAENIIQDGIAGAKTLQLLYDEGTSQNKNISTVNEPLEIGNSGPAVTVMQERLKELGYLQTVDGDFGAATFAAVLSFQTNNKLVLNGIVTANVFERMLSKGAKSATDKGNEEKEELSFLPASDAPNPKEVRYANWYTEIRERAQAMPNVTVYDPDSGLSYRVKLFSFGKHADGEPLTENDTQIMEQVCGKNNWTPTSVWVIFSDGKVYMASTHSSGHTVEHNEENGMSGHICIHFPRLMEEAERTGPYAVQHQKEILRGWQMTQAMTGK